MKKDSSPTRKHVCAVDSQTLAASAGTSTAAAVPTVATFSGTQPVPKTSLRTGFLRRRRKQVDAAEPAAATELQSTVTPSEIRKTEKSHKSSSGIVAGRKEFEIESGVEMLEDMIPHPSQTAERFVSNKDSIAEIAANADAVVYTKAGQNNAKHSRHVNITLPNLPQNSNETLSELGSFPEIFLNKEHINPMDDAAAIPKLQTGSTKLFQRVSVEALAKTARLTADHFKQALQLVPAISIMILLVLIMMPIHDFLRGIFACLLSIALIETIGKVLQGLIEGILAKNQPERGKFNVPDFDKMPICQLPAVEEHTNCKFYAGWMNEADSYDPDTFHISQTKSVYVRLEGTILQISTTSARIPKRVMWNETPIDLSKVIFTSHRRFDLQDCRIELLPLGLARKRFFNRKYPIQLIMKNTNNYQYVDLHGTQADIEGKKSNSQENITASTPTLAEQKDMHASARPSVESLDSRVRPSSASNIDADFGSIILNADLQPLQDAVNPDDDLKEITVPCGDEVRILLFSRGDREKEDWYRRFVNASLGKVHDQDLNLSKMKFVKEGDMQAAAARAAQLLTNPSLRSFEEKSNADDVPTTRSSVSNPKETEDESSQQSRQFPESTKNPEDVDAEAEKSLEEKFEGLLMSSCVARNPVDYVHFMALYQAACNEDHIPVYKKPDIKSADNKEPRRHKHRRARIKESDLWRGIDQSLFLGPSGSVVWANVLLGRVLFSCLNDVSLHAKIQEFLQKKINSLRLPSYMEDVVITQIYLGDTPPLIHRVSQPMLDERGIWLDADITYEGFANITVTTKLNLLRLKRPARGGGTNPVEAHAANPASTSNTASTTGTTSVPDINQRESREWQLVDETPSEELLSSKSGNAIYDSDAESTGGSDTETESPTTTERADTNTAGADFFAPTSSSPGNARRIFKLVDRFTTSNFFQYATELSYVQRAMENMSANITLRVDIKGLVGRGTINLPPPPSDRVWLCFRGPPRLWIAGHPTVGDKSVDWSIVTNVIESKLCDEVNKYLVYPNMVDLTIPFLAQPSYNTAATATMAAPATTTTNTAAAATTSTHANH